ncbi:hypothetical protein FRC07_000916 [Ceratobasidium sp. 392]|nr:hypothetical protein FRC07_000916 [Ceratobasidium sp. 392]
MRKLPANVSEENRLGTIITNPGVGAHVIQFVRLLISAANCVIQGPGGSGTAWVAIGGEELSTIVDGRYDILGFDPRGVNLTSPWTTCFDTEAEPLLLEYQLELLGVPYPHSTLVNDRALVNKISAIKAAHIAACLKNGNHKMLESSGTASVAQDMVKIVEALGEDGINYWGYSYGTILGATFAAMRPDLVKRMVLDGVSNAESYFNDVWQWGRDGMDETHKTLTGFLSTCAEAGPKYCAFAAPPGKSDVIQTTQTLRKRLNTIYARLNKHPMVVESSSVGPGVLTASSLQKNVFNRSMQRYITSESFHPIICGDSAATSISLNAYTNYFRELGQISPVGEPWASIVGGCNGWPFRAKQRHPGPWSAAEGLNKTRFPILLMSLDADPVTPLSSAVKMLEGFGNESAVLLVQQGFGHCTTEHPSLCTYKHVHDYFVNGKVPANGTHCTPEPNFIYPTSYMDKEGELRRSINREELLVALDRLREARSRFNLRPFSP